MCEKNYLFTHIPPKTKILSNFPNFAQNNCSSWWIFRISNKTKLFFPLYVDNILVSLVQREQLNLINKIQASKYVKGKKSYKLVGTGISGAIF